MQILGGRFKRLPIKSLPQMPYRPTKSIVRKSLFDKLSPFHYDSVLDLFSGTGIMGFEAASRGANSITFVEQHGKCIDLLKENSLKFSGPSYTFVRSNVYKYLKNNNILYDLIIADPPYGETNLDLLADNVLNHLNKNGKFILECEKKQTPLINSDVLDYGDTRILLWTK
ncbi:MAG: methyltransferase [Candidatus Marinimicrobia bacterium]|jgi:16S rRNA (guanine966-N2)-methyltransferase|nr:methyltransferase [Candidatus Neomarinimicrobiota bacterium]MBT3501091.1 methyltransferase [Candidatus Neomarinimicrobiota bacterium]MBT3838956.1 methyltransferase [Candidatus Neomarinimicrobiota bacterium]MBT4000220.1 methyltransferase [Candidatus Neomarinimicrobiota bacterium]MBT4282019.1 methyltransferase [Candidatus Neomarinimicrobiota bacterium]